MIRKKNKGISLIVLIITVVVIIILATAIIVNITKTNIIDNANEAVVKQDFKTFQNELTLYAANKYTATKGKFEIEKLNANSTSVTYTGEGTVTETNVYKIITSLENSKYKEYVIIKDGKIAILDTMLEPQKTWALEIINNVQNSNNENEEIASNKILSYNFGTDNKNIIKYKLLELNDITGNNSNAIANNVEITDSNDGAVLNGTSSYIQVNLEESLTFPMTIEMVIKPDSEKTGGIYFIDPASKVTLTKGADYFTTTVSTYATSYKIPDDYFNGDIKHIFVIYNSLTDSKMYINGVEIEKNTKSVALTSGIGSVACIGKRSSGDYTKGILYNFRIYNKALTFEEANTSYQNDKAFIEGNKEFITRENVIIEYVIKDNANNVKSKLLSKAIDCVKSNQGTAYNVSIEENQNGVILDGASSYIEVDLEENLTFPLTIEMVIKPNSEKTGGIYFIDPASKVTLTKGADYFTTTVSTYANSYKIPDNYFSGETQHIVVAYNSLTDSKMYINGVEIEKNTSTSALTVGIGSTACIGKREQGDYAKGTLYEFNIYNIVLSNTEINNKYSQIQNKY